jgi:hypothetical protein
MSREGGAQRKRNVEKPRKQRQIKGRRVRDGEGSRRDHQITLLTLTLAFFFCFCGGELPCSHDPGAGAGAAAVFPEAVSCLAPGGSLDGWEGPFLSLPTPSPKSIN